MAEGDTQFEVSAKLVLKKSKFESDVKKAAKSVTPLERAMERSRAGTRLAQQQLASFTAQQKLATQARIKSVRQQEAAEKAAAQEAMRRARDTARAEMMAAKKRAAAERAASQMAAKRAREMAQLARQANRASTAMARLQRKSIKGGFSGASGAAGMFGAGGGMAAMGGLGRSAGIAATAGGAGAALGVGGALVQGLRFNKIMEDTKQSVATMFAMFDIGKSYLNKDASAADIFNKNVSLAEAASRRILELQADTPAGATQLAQVFGQGMAGLAKGTKDVEKMLQLTTQISLLGPSLNNDYGQLGRDTMRILSGSAEQEVQVWRLLKEQFKELAESKGMLQKGMDHEAFTKAFNKTLTAAQRFELFTGAMDKVGPEFRDMFAKSMSGLLTTSGSKLQMIAGEFTSPLYESFKKAMAKANIGETAGSKGLLKGDMMDRWMGIAGYFGDRLAEGANKLYLAFERGAWYVDQHWSSITDNIILAFKIGGLLIKAYITQALARAMMAPALMATKGVIGAGKGMFSAFGKIGKLAKKLPGFAELGTLAKFGRILGIMAIAAVPAMLAFLSLAAALSVVAFAAAAIAAYFVKNWAKITKSILDNWSKIGPMVERVTWKFYYLMDQLAAVGGILLGGGTGADMMIVALELLEIALGFAAKAIVAFVRTLSFLEKFTQPFQGMALEGAESDLRNLKGERKRAMEAQARTEERMAKAGPEYASVYRKDVYGAQYRVAQIDDQIRQKEKSLKGMYGSAATSQSRTAQLDALANQLDMRYEPEAVTERNRKARATAEALQAALTNPNGDGSDAKRTPKGGVHVTNMYNQWDLRNTDPDRLMSAFLPKLEGLADKRTQGRDVQPQGI